MGFAAEMKDFNTAVAQGQKMVGATDDAEYKRSQKAYTDAQTETINQKNNDTEGQAADLAGKLAKNRATGLSADANAEWIRQSKENSAVAAQQRQAQVDADKAVAARQAGAVSAGGYTPSVAPAYQPPAAPAVQPTGIPAVQGFADGGAVGEEPDDEALPAPPTPQAVPADEPEKGASDATDISARRRGFSGQAGIDATRAGMTYGAQLHGLHAPAGVPTPGRQRSAKDYASGVGAAPAEDMEKLRNQVDPEHKLGESEANLAALGAVYQFKMGRGDTEGAARTAWQMLQYHRQASQRYAVIAAHAADSGDLDTATHAAMKAYANVPDGKDVKFQRTPDGQIAYTYTDSATGKVMARGIEPPDKLAAAAMGFAAKGFDQSLIASISGQPQPKEAPPAVDPNSIPLKPADEKAHQATIDTAYASQNPPVAATSGGEDTPARPAADERALKGAALRIKTNTENGRITADEAMSVATRLADPRVQGEKSSMKMEPAPGGYKVSFDGRKPVFVHQDDAMALMALRKQNEAAAKKTADEAAKPSAVSRAIGAVKEAAAPYVAKLTMSGEPDTPKQREVERARRKTFTEPQIP